MMFFVAAVQFTLATGHAIMIVVQLVRGFGGTSPNTLYWVNQGRPAHLVQEFLYLTNVRRRTSKINPDIIAR